MALTVITIANQKGGVGKTNTAVQLAVQMGRQGYGPVVLLDADAPQGSLSAWYNQRSAELEEPLMAVINPGETLESKIKMLGEAGARLMIIDTGPRDPKESPMVASAILNSDIVLIPTKVGWRDAQAAVPTFNFCSEHGKKFMFVLNEAKASMSLTSQTVALLSEYGPVAPGFISSRAVFVNADASSMAAVEIEPRGRAAAEVQALIDHLVKKLPAFAKPVKEKKHV